MKLNEIIEPEIITKNYKGQFRYPQKPNTNAEMGFGYFSVTRTDKSDPHMVIKRHKKAYDFKEGFDIFAQNVVDNKLYKNIHFPKIYKSTDIKDKENQSIKKWQIERLYPFKSLSEKELIHLVESYFYPSSFENFLSHGEKMIRFKIVDILKVAIYKGNYDPIKSDELKNALAIIKKMYENQTGIMLDLHQGNVMIRRTPYGNQLVITDPFA